MGEIADQRINEMQNGKYHSSYVKEKEMNIAQIKQLDDGISGIVLQGTLKKIMDAKNIVGTGQKGPYNFWSQFMVVEDKSGDIGVSVNFNDSSFSFNASLLGTPVILKGIVSSYQGKDGYTKKLDRCKVVQATPAPATQPNPEAQAIIDNQFKQPTGPQAAEQIQDRMAGPVNPVDPTSNVPDPPIPTPQDYAAKEREKVLGMCFTNLLSGRLSNTPAVELEKDLGEIAAIWRLSAMCIDGTGRVEEDSRF